MIMLDKLPAGGQLFFAVPVAPVSQQAVGKSRKKFKADVKRHIPDTAFLYSDDVHLDIIWRCSEAHKYESHKSLDLDNLSKPLIDALVGELLIDDTQLVSILISWIDWESDSESLEVRLKSHSELIVLKQGLEFVEFGRGLCLPISDIRLEDGSMPDVKRNAEIKLMFLDAFERMVNLYFKGKKYPETASMARLALPQQRIFHRNKVEARWPVIELATKREQLRALSR